MTTAREKIKQCSNSMFVSEQSELVDRLVYAFHEYAQEAIKADRLNLLKHIEINDYDEHGQYSPSINKDSIINAPMIELL